MELSLVSRQSQNLNSENMSPARHNSSFRLHWPAWPKSSSAKERAVSIALLAGRWAVAGPRTGFSSHREIFAKAFAAYVGRRYCVPTVSGSSAIVLALQALGIGPGDRVVVPAMTWVGCATAVLRVGATPVFCKCAAPGFIGDYLSINPLGISGVLAVHTYSCRVDIAALEKHFPGVPIIEDFSHCHGARISGTKLAGASGIVSICSLQASKLLTCGEGGCVLTDGPDLASLLEALATDSRVRDNENGMLKPGGLLHGANHAMSEIHASLALAHLQSLEEELQQRASSLRLFAELTSFRKTPTIYSPDVLKDGALYGLPVRMPGKAAELAIEHLEREIGLKCDRVYPPIPVSPLYRPESIRQYASASQETSSSVDEHDIQLHRDWLLIPHSVFLAGEKHMNVLANVLSGVDITELQGKKRTPIEVPQTCTVIILTRDREMLLRRALRSVRRQKCVIDLQVLILNNGATLKFDPKCELGNIPNSVVTINGELLDKMLPIQRVSHLRNFAVSCVGTDFLSFLDDDNEWEPDHLCSLFQLIRQTGSVAVHSWRTVQDESGRPVGLLEFPWARTMDERLSRFADAVQAGILHPGSPEVHDCVQATVGNREIGMVDMGCWIFARDFVKALPFTTEFSTAEIRAAYGEDDKLLDEIRKHAIPVECSKRASLRYTLGGFSNKGGWCDR